MSNEKKGNVKGFDFWKNYFHCLLKKNRRKTVRISKISEFFLFEEFNLNKKYFKLRDKYSRLHDFLNILKSFFKILSKKTLKNLLFFNKEYEKTYLNEF